MKLVCGPAEWGPHPVEEGTLRVVLYGQAGAAERASAGEAVRAEMLRRKLEAAPRAWDLLSLALAVVTADLANPRAKSPDGWTREFVLEIAVAEPDFWNEQAVAIGRALAFLTTDRWQLRFLSGGALPVASPEPVRPEEDSTVLLSGGLDSLVGAIDLVASGKQPLAVSQTVRGDAAKQMAFAAQIGGGLRHLQFNHNARVPSDEEKSQRARSLIFLTFGVLAATTLRRYHAGEVVPLYVCENGFIAVNPPLTGGRLGSLSTRTTRPEFLAQFQRILYAADLRVQIENPYQLRTKGEMLRSCADQDLLRTIAATATSCGRFQRFAYTHCGRCVPCQVRRAAFLAWGVADTTDYVYEPLGRSDADHAGFDDVRSVAMAIAQVRADGLESWIAPALNSTMIADVAPLKDLVQRGLDELDALHQRYRIR